jgi:hypothetical protein
MSGINTVIDAFIACNSLINARKLVAHVNRHPMVLCMISEDHAGQVRNAERMVETDRLAHNANNMRFSRR